MSTDQDVKPVATAEDVAALLRFVRFIGLLPSAQIPHPLRGQIQAQLDRLTEIRDRLEG
jgi:hypothetical protein